MVEPVVECGACRLRPWRVDDLEALLRHANDARVSRGLRDRFPFPYTRADGESYLVHVSGPHPDWCFAIEVDGEACGGLGIHPGEDVHRFSAELGYWLGRERWGRGIAGAAIRAVLPLAMQHFRLHRVHAGVYSNNPASMRVLEKCGFEREGIARRAVYKRGELLDVVNFAYVRADIAG